MAFDFPAAPALNAEYTSGGVTYVFNGQGWTLKAGAAVDDWVNVTGDTMTGDLTFISSTIYYEVPALAVALQAWTVAGAVHWTAGMTAAGDWGIGRYVSGAFVDSPFSLVSDGRVLMPGVAGVTIGSGSNALLQIVDYNNRWNNLGQLVITNEGFKAVAGPWAAGSDARIKTVNGNYTQGLAALKQINPVRFEFKGNVTETETKSGEPPPAPMHQHVMGKEFIGLVAQDVETIMPEMVSQKPAFIDGTAVNDLRMLDITGLTYALINAVKELSARIEALEGATPTTAKRK